VESDHLCRAKKRRSERLCTRPAGWGTDHAGVGRCKLHGGASPTYRREAERLRAKQAVKQYGLSIDKDPHAALMEELQRTTGHVAWLRLKVGELADEQLVGLVGMEGATEAGLRSHPRYEPNVYVRMYRAERTHLTRIAKTCIDAGIEEHRVRIVEEQGQLIARAIQGILTELGVGERPETPKIVRRYLALIGTVESPDVDLVAERPSRIATATSA
jgi:hypothetical protein